MFDLHPPTDSRPKPLLSRILWYRKTESGRLIPQELSLDAPVVLGGANGSGKTTLLRILPFLLGVPNTAVLRPSRQLLGFGEFYLQDALLLAEFVHPHPKTYLFAGTSRGIQVLAIQAPLDGVKEAVDAFLRQRATVSGLIAQLKRAFAGRTQEMGYEEYTASLPVLSSRGSLVGRFWPAHLGSFLHALLQERVSLRRVSEALGRLFDETHQITTRLLRLRESLERDLERARRITELHGLLQDFPRLEEDLGRLLGKAQEVGAAKRRLEALLKEGQALALQLEVDLRQGQARLQELQAEKAPLGDRKVLEEEKRALEKEFLHLQEEGRVRQKDTLAALRALPGDWPPPATLEDALPLLRRRPRRYGGRRRTSAKPSWRWPGRCRPLG